MNLQDSKAGLRSKMQAALAAVSPSGRMAASIEICERLKAQLQSAHTILFFAPLTDEPDVWPLLQELLAGEKVIALPFFDAEEKIYGARRLKNLEAEIVNGKFGVREPASSCAGIPLDKFDLILVPGAAFDLRGNRLGRGRGFYDRLLENAGGMKCGVCYDGQLLEKIPAEPHDAKVDFILTPTRGVKAAK
jgi:5-formyltetrahydrofolate cyclo-ligase